MLTFFACVFRGLDTAVLLLSIAYVVCSSCIFLQWIVLKCVAILKIYHLADHFENENRMFS